MAREWKPDRRTRSTCANCGDTYYYGQPRQQCRTCARASRAIREGKVA